MIRAMRQTLMGRTSPREHAPGGAHMEHQNGGLGKVQPAAPIAESPPPAPARRQPRRPRRIILVRHGQSAGNVDETVYTHTPDWKVSLTDKGRDQAQAAGRSFKKILDGDAAAGPVFIYSSPYARCQETVEHLVAAAGVPESRIVGRRQEPRIREQDFGNFQDPQKMRECKVSRNEFGRFFYRFPNGESGADVYDRVSTWLETLYREMEFGLITPDTTLLLVTHGLTARLILMRWYHWSVEAFEETYNPGNAQLMVMERHTDAEGGLYYVLAPEAIAAIRLPEEAQAQEEIERKRQLLITKNMSARDIKNDAAPPTPAATKKAMSKEDSVEVLEC